MSKQLRYTDVAEGTDVYLWREKSYDTSRRDFNLYHNEIQKEITRDLNVSSALVRSTQHSRPGERANEIFPLSQNKRHLTERRRGTIQERHTGICYDCKLQRSAKIVCVAHASKGY